jgi:hypothetical protein
MKLKKLLAAVVAGVLALTMAPIAVSAATAGDTQSSFTNGGGGVALTSLTIDGKNISWEPTKLNSTVNTATIKGTVNYSYSEINEAFTVAWNIPAGTTITPVYSDDDDWTTQPTFTNGSSYQNVTFDSTHLKSNDSTTLTLTLANSTTPWELRNVYALNGDLVNYSLVDFDVESVDYEITISITPPDAYDIKTATPTNYSYGLFTVTNNTIGTPATTAQTNSTRAHANDTITLSPPIGTNAANENEEFAYYEISPSVEAISGTGFKSGPMGDSIEAGHSYNKVYYSGSLATDAFVFKMPARGVTITAFDKDGFAFGTKSTSSTTPGTSTSNLSAYGLYNYSNGTQYITPGTTVFVSPRYTSDFQYWTLSNVPGYSNYTTLSTQSWSFIMPDHAVSITANNYAESNVTATTNGYGSASASRSTANVGEIVTFTASSTGTSTATSSNVIDPYYYYYGGNLAGSSYYYPTYTYTFSGWSFNRSVTYVSGYSSTSNPTQVIMPSGSLTGTANFTYTTSGSYIPVTPSVPTTSNSFTNNGATATINTSTGVVTAGINSSGSVNSTATNNALKAAINRRLVDGAATVVVPSTSSGLSKSTVQKLLTAAGSRGLRIQIEGAFGTILVPVSSARQINTRVYTSSNALTNAKATFKRAFGNTDIVGIQTAQASTFGSSATYRVSAGAIGLNADYGDTVYVAIYNPSTGKYSKKTVMVNANGQIAFASSYSGIFLFSAKPWSAK